MAKDQAIYISANKKESLYSIIKSKKETTEGTTNPNFNKEFQTIENKNTEDFNFKSFNLKMKSKISKFIIINRQENNEENCVEDSRMAPKYFPSLPKILKKKKRSKSIQNKFLADKIKEKKRIVRV